MPTMNIGTNTDFNPAMMSSSMLTVYRPSTFSNDRRGR